MKTAEEILSDMTGIPVYRINGEYITKKGALEAMELYASERLDSYKESLRSAIAVTNSPNGDDYFMDGYEQGLLKAMELIDTVTPKE